MNLDIHFIQEVTSTNTVLKEMISSGIPEGYVLAAHSQTAGRGRLGRSFFSPAGSGLYFSILLRPKLNVKPATLTCLSAVALAETVLSYGIPCAIKWVNDLYCGDKKAAGILTEGAFDSSGHLSYAIVGIGLNLYLPENVPDELQSIITGIFHNQEETKESHIVLDDILSRLVHYYELLPEQSFWQTYRSLLNCFGRKVSFVHNGETMHGTAEDIDRDFRLIIRTETGCFPLERGEVTFL